MTTIGEQQFMNAVPACLNRIANCLEELVKHQRLQNPELVMSDQEGYPTSLEAWKLQVAQNKTTAGYSDWVAWQRSEKDDPDRTCPGVSATMKFRFSVEKNR